MNMKKLKKKSLKMRKYNNLMKVVLGGGIIILAMGAETKAASITSISDSVRAGKKLQLEAETKDNETVTWSIDKPKYAAINSKGVLTAKKAGKIKVMAADSEGTDAITVTITPKKTVAIDAGHQQRGDSSTEPIGPGSSTRKAKVAGGTSGVSTKVPEYKLTLSVAKKLKKELVNRGYKVVMIRTKNDVNISNSERAKKANKTSDICIRLHADGTGDSSVNGASALCPSTSNKYVGKLGKASKKLSEHVLNSMCDETGARNRGISIRDDLTGTNWSTIPVTLIEMGFMTNKTEDINMQKKEYQEKLAKGMAKGVEHYFGF